MGRCCGFGEKFMASWRGIGEHSTGVIGHLRIRLTLENSSLCGVPASCCWFRKVCQSLSSENIGWNRRHSVLFLYLSGSSETWLGLFCMTSVPLWPSQCAAGASQEQGSYNGSAGPWMQETRSQLPGSCDIPAWGCHSCTVGMDPVPVTAGWPWARSLCSSWPPLHSTCSWVGGDQHLQRAWGQQGSLFSLATPGN